MPTCAGTSRDFRVFQEMAKDKTLKFGKLFSPTGFGTFCLSQTNRFHFSSVINYANEFLPKTVTCPWKQVQNLCQTNFGGKFCQREGRIRFSIEGDSFAILFGTFWFRLSWCTKRGFHELKVKSFISLEFGEKFHCSGKARRST